MLRVVTEATNPVVEVVVDGGGSAEDVVCETDSTDDARDADVAVRAESDNVPIDEFPAGRGIAPPSWIDEAEPLKSPYE
jgi:hypothetical protein